MTKGRAGGGKFLGLGLLLLILLGLGGLVWLERTTLLAWFRVRLLSQATDGNRASRAAEVARVGEAAVPGLLDCLRQNQPGVCRNARAGLSALVEGAGARAEPRTAEVALRLAGEYAEFSVAGQQQALELAAEWFHDQREPAAGLMQACARLLGAATASTDPGVQTAALKLCAALAAHPQGAETLSSGRELVRACLQAGEANIRLQAIQVGLYPGMDLLEPIAALLGDPCVEVRRAAVVAVGPPEAARVVLDETLLPCLRDPDEEVRHLCEERLVWRGLTPTHLELARLLTDPKPSMRLRVLEHLRKCPDLDPGVWLRRLSHDPALSVRAAACRAMGEQRLVDLTDRIDQMARTDPSPTICELAAYYLKKHARALNAEQAQP